MKAKANMTTAERDAKPAFHVPQPSPAVRSAMKGWPDAVQDVALTLRRMIFETAAETGTGPLSETLKWGQPAYLNTARKVGTTLRLGYAPDQDNPCRLLVHCGTDLVDRYRERFGAELDFEGNRAICLPARTDLPDGPLRQCIAMALCYHLD